MSKFTDIIERVEKVRTLLGMNKSRFSAQINMKPQTYNNFIGSQRSKPNIELVYGIVEQFNVNPGWLLSGSGEPFPDGPTYPASASQTQTIAEPRSPFVTKDHRKTLLELKDRLESLAPSAKNIESDSDHIKEQASFLLGELQRILEDWVATEPVRATREILEFVSHLENILSEL